MNLVAGEVSRNHEGPVDRVYVVGSERTPKQGCASQRRRRMGSREKRIIRLEVGKTA